MCTARNLFFVLVISGFALQTVFCYSECAGENDLDAIKLRKNLLCNYEKNLRPVKSNKDPVRVTIRMIVKYFMFDMHANSFSLDSWLAMNWRDEHLVWKPSEHNSIETIHLSSYDIWMPDLSIYNRDDQSGSPAAISEATCIVTASGIVVCVPPTRQVSLCVGDLTLYPFDEQNCTVRLGSWVHSGEEIDFVVPKLAISTEDMVPNGEWALIDSQMNKHPGKFKCCPNNTYPSLNFSFKIRRLAGSHVASVILPAIALIVLTLTSLWVPPDQTERLLLCCVNLICEFLYAQYVSWMLPSIGDKIPLILLFARDSLVLCSFTIVFSLALKRVVKKTSPAPEWISGTVSVLIGCRCGQFMLLDDTTLKGVAVAKDEEDSATILENGGGMKKENVDWIVFGKILDRLCFLSYCIVYLCMFVAFTP